MDRISNAGGSPTATLTNGAQGFQDENLSTGVEGTTVTAEFMNAVQEELMTILAAADITPNISNFGQVLQALQSLLVPSGGIEALGANIVFPFQVGGSGKFQVQIGQTTIAGGSSPQTINVPFAVPFPTACVFPGGILWGAPTASTYLSWTVTTFNASGMAIEVFSGAAIPELTFIYLAVGY